MDGPSKNSGYCKGLVCTRRIHIRHTIQQIRHLRLQSLSSKTTNIYVPVPYFWSTPTLWTSDRCIIGLWSIRCAGITILTYIIGPKKSPYICTAWSVIWPRKWVIQWIYPWCCFSRCSGMNAKKKTSGTHDRTLRPPAASEKIRKNGGTLRGRCQQKTTEDLTAGFHHHSLDFLFCSDRFTWKNGWRL